jgi:hypothetical protein
MWLLDANEIGSADMFFGLGKLTRDPLRLV